VNSRGRKQLRWVKQVQVSPAAPSGQVPPEGAAPTTRERLVAALADRPQTVAQLARSFGLSQPTVLEHVRRAVGEGLLVEVQVPAAERRFVAERYYAPAVPVIRQPDRELLESACRSLAGEIADTLARHQGDLRAAFAMTTLAREGWAFGDLWPYLHATIERIARQHGLGFPLSIHPPLHGLAWVEDVAEFDLASDDPGATWVECQEKSA
jgi:DNA-binding transcriptional ArsR family regulator